MWLAWRYVARDRDGRDQPLDGVGGLLVTLALGALTWALTVGSGREGWTAGAVAAAIGGLALLAAFLRVEGRRGDLAMMPLGLFGSKSFVGLTLLTLLLYGALGGLFVLIPYLLIEAAGYSGAEAGAALLPLPLVLSLASPLMGGLAGRIGPRLPLSIGPLVVAAGFLLALRIGEDVNYWRDVLPAILVIAIGMSGAVAPLTTAVLSAVDARHTGSASGFNSAIARTGGLIATAVLGAVLASKGAPLFSAFHTAMLVGAAACAVGGACAFGMVGRDVGSPRPAP